MRAKDLFHSIWWQQQLHPMRSAQGGLGELGFGITPRLWARPEKHEGLGTGTGAGVCTCACERRGCGGRMRATVCLFPLSSADATACQSKGVWGIMWVSLGCGQ